MGPRHHNCPLGWHGTQAPQLPTAIRPTALRVPQRTASTGPRTGAGSRAGGAPPYRLATRGWVGIKGGSGPRQRTEKLENPHLGSEATTEATIEHRRGCSCRYGKRTPERVSQGRRTSAGKGLPAQRPCFPPGCPQRPPGVEPLTRRGSAEVSVGPNGRYPGCPSPTDRSRWRSLPYQEVAVGLTNWHPRERRERAEQGMTEFQVLNGDLANMITPRSITHPFTQR